MKQVVAQVLVTTLVIGTLTMGAESETRCTRVVSLDGEWLLATDPQNAGRTQQWMLKPVPEAKKAKVPWIIQDTFPGYHGLAWYWRTFTPSPNPHAQGRYLLRFWAVDYKAEVWLNGARIGDHEGGETPFVLDVTDSLKPGALNLLAVRVLNPTHTPIDGIVLNETPHRNKVMPYSSGSAWNQGGIMDSVELLVAPPVRVEGLFARPDWKTGVIRVQASVRNALAVPAKVRLEFAVAPAASGETLGAATMESELAPGDTHIEAQLHVEKPRLWNLNDPFLYRVTARVRAEGSNSMDEHSVRCGFRDFRFENGWFRLNGRRIYLRCSHTGNCCPVGRELPVDPDWLRRDLVNVKAMRFNAIRWIAGVAKRYQLDLCDELGLMVYEESYAGWCLADSPKMAERYDESVLGMVRRDRNHPSVVIWGLLNETPDGPVFRHAVRLLPTLRKLDDSRMVLLNSGRWDRVATASERVVGVEGWRSADRVDPCVIRNVTDHVVKGLGITWAPGQLSFHPGRDGEYSVVRWTAPAAAKVELTAKFAGIAEKATTDVHLLHNGKALFDAFINVKGAGNEAQFTKTLDVQAGDTLDVVVGYGNGNYGADTTAVDVTVKAEGGKVYNATTDFTIKANPNGPWSYGQLAPGAAPNAATFKLYPKKAPGEEAELSAGTFSNPGSAVWEDSMDDQHPYKRVPHTAGIIRELRTAGNPDRPLFLSEYGVGSAVDLLRVVRLYEQIGKGEADDARFYRAQRDKFLADWERWRLAEAFDRPEDFFAQSNAKMAGQRLLGINAIRSNPKVVGYSLTGTVDQGMTGEGLFTTFRELKPGTLDAVFDGFAPLRFCLFVEPVNVYRGTKVRLEAVLANEDALLPGEYPVRLQVVGPPVGGASLPRVFERTVKLTIPDPKGKAEPPMVLPVFEGQVVVDGPSGKYRFLATIERGAAAAGEAVEFYVADPAEMPPVEAEVALWGEDAALSKWLSDHGIRVAQAAAAARREVILVGAKPPGDAAAFADLARRIARGSTAIFLCPEVFRKGGNPVGWLPLANKGSLAAMRSWVYLKDEWAKPHPIFDGLPTGGLMDLTFYRDLIPDHVWAGQDAPAEAVAGGINASQAYSSGLLVAVYPLGAGRFVLNTLRIREELGRHPAAERLLRNLLRTAARDAAKHPAELPAAFDQQLKALGYE
ncbi:MAG TPA: glycoside hydrolase family 2 TIM barrel-domain containing protein [Planctomycetota bacterium]|nr:glycoside hydrolase family 2 TIM barrel-domain containing protein [Planctomycetota bacterium]